MVMYNGVILNLPVAASQTITAGDWLSLDVNGYAIKNATNETTKVIGLAETSVTTLATEAGTKRIGARTGVGTEEVVSLVEETGAGYDSAIVPGEPVALGGNAALGNGQHVVALDGTDAITYGRGVVGIALEPNVGPGATPVDTVATIKIKLNVI